MQNSSSDQSTSSSTDASTATSNEPFDDFVAKLAMKERAYATKRAAAMADDPARLWLWRRMAVKLFSLAKHSAKVNSQESIQFYVADGKYRMQMWSLQDNEPGLLTIHCRDLLDELLQKKILRRPAANEPDRYPVNTSGDSLVIQRVLPQAAEHPAAFRDLMSWGRKCMRIDLPINSSVALLDILDTILDMSRAVKK